MSVTALVLGLALAVPFPSLQDSPIEVRRPDDDRPIARLSGPRFEALDATSSKLTGAAAARRVAALRPGAVDLAPPGSLSSDLVIGDDPHDELLVITGPFEHDGRILVINQGRLVFERADARVRGSFVVLDDGRLEVLRSSLVLESSYLYEHTSIFLGQAIFEVRSSRLDHVGGTHGFWAADDARLRLWDVESNGALTAALEGQARARLGHVRRAGEWVVLGANRVSYTSCDGIILWLSFGDGTLADVEFPDGAYVPDFVYPLDPGPRDPPWRARVRDCTNVLFTVMAEAGCDLTLRDSMVRAVGLIFEGGGFELAGLVNGAFHESWELPLDDRRVALHDAGVETWNVYPMQGATGTIDRCVLGEVLVMESEAAITRTLLDGTGGYFSATGPGFTTFLMSGVVSPITTRDEALLLLAAAGVTTGELRIDGGGILVAAQTPLRVRPVVSDRGLSVVGWLDAPVDPRVDTVVSLSGTAVIDAGPQWPDDLASYLLEYAAVDDPDLWNPITIGFSELWSDPLGSWSTAGLTPGPYYVRLTLTDWYQNVVEVLDVIELER